LDAGWVGWGDFLGTGNLHARDRKFCTYVEVREFARGLPVRTATGWRVFCRGEIEGWSRPPDVPANPERYFRDRGWHSWREFFGTGDPGSG